MKNSIQTIAILALTSTLPMFAASLHQFSIHKAQNATQETLIAHINNKNIIGNTPLHHAC